ncbi:hypothetical protein NECAME_15397 [Necator americanus]|uniref:Protein LLP homolog n=1 Tax=Necator americanus TaxID=51031 RepID=W2SKQ5_NECAM|nr:hypothetical protein NECAME_15397 [Necator americanus]ETN69297.1 hypothetical protein NECAME_15397 [Necator americanus]
MAKSLRSKFKRKIRSIARAKKAHKELTLLEGAVARRVEYEREQEAKETDTVKNAPGSDKVESMDDAAPRTVKTATINVKTMKRADGTYPPWMTGNHKNKLSKQNKAAKKKRLLKTKSRR